MNYDQRLETKYRKRTQEEIDELLKEDYRLFLQNELFLKGVGNLLSRLTSEVRESLIEDVIYECTKAMDGGHADKAFMRTVDASALEWEES